MSDTFIRTDLYGVIERVSMSVTDLLGYREDELLGRETSQFYVDANDRQQMLQRLEQEGEVHDYEMQFRRKDEQII
ncbi:PAS domain S-box protein [Candidatus Reidiella endopervernicosa]|uniref:PAS domain S-box protein n=2 Tax=Candidatus Reidiella endopervernicosa TaxID=2738883 RepID=A0A6N0HSQ1_9GAMM|nr:PAS domain S-box protein [Candidatus Reidiella endopervernicosa]